MSPSICSLLHTHCILALTASGQKGNLIKTVFCQVRGLLPDAGHCVVQTGPRTISFCSFLVLVMGAPFEVLAHASDLYVE